MDAGFAPGEGSRGDASEGDAVRTLRTRTEELARILEGHQADEEEALAIGRLAGFARSLDSDVTRLSGYVDAGAELQRHNTVAVAPGQLAAFAESIEFALAEAEVDGLAAGRGNEPGVVQLAADVRQETASSVRRAWKDLKQRHRPPDVDEELLGLAAQEDSTLTRRYESAQTRLYVLREKEWPAEGDVSSWLETVDECRAIADEVASRAPSQEVVDFLREAGSPAGAPLERLTSSEVKAWLDEGDRSQRYRVFARTLRR